MTDRRPDPGELLKRVQEEDRRQRRGKLKIFFGAAPGVGKTYAMLEEARKLYGQGVDVVVGLVETHKRAETEALVLGLDVLPRREAEYRGATLMEFDLDAALKRRPEILLVDELAHSNAPGSKFAKRYEDVQALLDAGISVYTTLNVQHLESVNDIVSQITGIAVRETVPDSVVEDADEIKLIDLPPDALLERLREGKVYLAESARAAQSNFFRKGNLTALRELALRRTAEHVDSQVNAYRREQGETKVWAASERILVCIGPSPLSAKLLRAAKRLAVGLRADLIAAYVETARSLRLSQPDRERVMANFRLAESLGAETVTVKADNVAQAVVDYARSRNVSKIVIGKTQVPRLREVLFGSVTSDLIRQSGDLDVYVIRGEEEERGADRPVFTTVGEAARGWGGSAVALACVSVATGVAGAVAGVVEPSNVAMLYLLGVVIAGAISGRGPALLATLLSVVCFNFFFVPPVFTFLVDDHRFLITFGVMGVVGAIIAQLTSQVREQADAAQAREWRASSLYNMSRELAAARTLDDVIESGSRHIRETFASSVCILLPDDDGKLAQAPGDKAGFTPDPTDLGAAQWAADHGQTAGLGTATLPAARAMFLPLSASQGRIGVLGVKPHQEGQHYSLNHLHLLETFADQLAQAIERTSLIRETQSAQIQAETERLRSALLSSVSHDLRTPLSIVTGAATTLLGDGPALDEGTRRALTESICQEADRLNQLINNLVFATRLESGNIQLRREWLAVEEVVGSALNRLRERVADRTVRTFVPADLPLVQGDPVLIEQVVINLLENALRHTPPGTPIDVSSWSNQQSVIIKVADQGPGLSQGEEQRVFDRFYRGRANTTGLGLGLYICRGIVAVHGGRCWAESSAGQGAAFLFSLPVDAAPPVAIEPDDAAAVPPAPGAASAAGSGAA